jgi:hypothetical protein
MKVEKELVRQKNIWRKGTKEIDERTDRREGSPKLRINGNSISKLFTLSIKNAFLKGFYHTRML